MLARNHRDTISLEDRLNSMGVVAHKTHLITQFNTILHPSVISNSGGSVSQIVVEVDTTFKYELVYNRNANGAFVYDGNATADSNKSKVTFKIFEELPSNILPN